LAISNKTEGVENDYTTVGYWNEKKEAWHDFLPGIKRRILVNNSAVTLTYYRFPFARAGAVRDLHAGRRDVHSCRKDMGLQGW
jgi:hypothetical protein